MITLTNFQVFRITNCAGTGFAWEGLTCETEKEI